MKITANNISFSYSKKNIFKNFNLEIDSDTVPLIILGASGCGKTTLIKLLGGLLKPDTGEITCAQKSSFMFQEPRLLPWLTVLENVELPLIKYPAAEQRGISFSRGIGLGFNTLMIAPEGRGIKPSPRIKDFGKKTAHERALEYLSLVSLYEKRDFYPCQISGGEAQRVSMARAFAWPSDALFIDEPFQSLDIGLRKNLMDLLLSLKEKENRLLIMVTHESEEAVYIGKKVIILGDAQEGIVFEKMGANEAELKEKLIENYRQNHLIV